MRVVGALTVWAAGAHGVAVSKKPEIISVNPHVKVALEVRLVQRNRLLN